MHELAARHYINRCVSGCDGKWPLEWFKEHFPYPFELGLSLGCGTGELERDVASKGICQQIEGIDLSPKAIEIAKQQAHSVEGAINYRVADLNYISLDEECADIAFFHQSLHHVERLENCLDEVKSALVNDGVLYLDEYVGPSRGEWSRDLVAQADRIYREIPRQIRGTSASVVRGRVDIGERLRNSPGAGRQYFSQHHCWSGWVYASIQRSTGVAGLIGGEADR